MDDEVWAKIVVMEKESRLAKAYIKTPVVGIDGSTLALTGSRSASTASRAALAETRRAPCASC